jgi:hypothetical protein
MIIKASNINTTNVPKTYTSVSQAIGVGTLYIKNPNDFQASWAVQVGDTGQAEAEVVLASGASPSGTSIVLSGTTKYAHAADSPVYAIKYDQVVFTKAVAGTAAGTSGPITNGTVTLTPNLSFTQFDDTTAAATDYFRTYFLNSSTSGSTSYSDWISPAGYSFYSLAYLTQRVRDKLWDSNYIKTDDVIHDWLNEWKDEMANAVINVNENYSLGSVAVSFGTNGLGTITDASFTNPRRLWVNYSNSGTAESTKIDPNDVYPGQTFSASMPRHTWVGNNVFQIFPSSTSGTASLLYYQFGTTLVNDTDELPQPMRSFTKSFVDYALAQAFNKDDNGGQYDRAINQALSAKADFVTKITNRDMTGPTFIKLNEVINGDDGYYF